MRKFYRLVALGLLLITGACWGRQVQGLCGTSRVRLQEELARHRRQVWLRRQVQPGKPSPLGKAPAAFAPPAAGRDGGPTNDLAIIEDADGVVTRRNDFNLEYKTLTFEPAGAAASRYRFTLTDTASYDAAAASAGTLLEGLQDDDTRQATLPFSFPFFGASYQQVYINSDGNLTFETGDTAWTERSLGRMAAGPPRIAPLFRDLDPSHSRNGVYVLADSSRFVVSWVSVPEFADVGTGPLQTFQVRLYPNGRMEFAYSRITTNDAVVGIAPGRLRGGSSVVAFIDGSRL